MIDESIRVHHDRLCCPFAGLNTWTMMHPTEYLHYLQQRLDPQGTEPWEPENTYGLFGLFRPTGAGVEQVFAPFEDGAAYLARLLPIYAATAGPECARDAYFIVRCPQNLTQPQQTVLGQEFVNRLRLLAETIGDPELSAVLQQTREMVHRELTEADFLGDEHLTVCETIGDWFSGLPAEGEPIDVLREAYDSIAADDWLARHLQWPRYRRFCHVEVFAPYVELWQAGLRCVFQPQGLVIGLS
jgi:hypothetical protein